jgi:hypothetical protein
LGSAFAMVSAGLSWRRLRAALACYAASIICFLLMLTGAAAP